MFYIFVYLFFNQNYIRENSTDFAWDLINEYWISGHKENTDTDVVVYSVDDAYLNAKHLLNKYQDKDRYGYLFPRRYIAEFIDKLNSRAQKEGDPIALFVDFDMQFTSLPLNRELSNDDIRLLKSLIAPRNYPIILVKNSTVNFIEQIEDKAHDDEEHFLAHQIAEQIKNHKIILASAELMASKDGIYRMYRPYRTFADKPERIYYSFEVIAWQLAKNHRQTFMQTVPNFMPNSFIDEKEIFANFDPKIYLDDAKLAEGYSLVESRILFKDAYSVVNIDKDHNTSDRSIYSDWENLLTQSAHMIDSDKVHIPIVGRIILFGFDSFKGNDNFETFATYQYDNNITTSRLSGVQTHANALMTLLSLDGKLRRIPLLDGALIVFVFFFIIDLTFTIFLQRLQIGGMVFLLNIAFSSIVFFLISGVLLLKWHLWFNWSVPVLLYTLSDFYVILKEHVLESAMLASFRKKQREADE